MPRRSQPTLALKPFAGESTAVAFIHRGGAGTGTQDFEIKVTQAQMSFGTDFIDATGEASDATFGAGDGSIVSDTNMQSLGQVRGEVVMQGYCVSTASAIGLANLEDSAKSTVDVLFTIGYGRNSSATAGDQKQIKFQMTVSRVSVNFDIDQPFVGLSIQGQVTGQYGSSGNPLQEA
tara:strand:- start:326 stop:856 length:531 start_codon:yes stop_codon:yes gene_type:complete